MTTPAPVKKRGRKPKSELQQEFEDLTREVTEAQSLTTSKLKDVLKEQEQEVRESVKDVSSEQVVRKFADFSVDISRTLTSLSDQIIQEINQLSNLRQAVILESKELERLHKIDIAQTALDNLIEEYATKESELTTEIETMQEQHELEISAREEEASEYEESLAKSRKRETEEYEYKKNLERKKAQDKYDEEIRLRDKQNKEKQEQLERSWNEREGALTGQEEELVSLRKAVEEFPDRLEKEVARASLEAVRQTEQRLSQELAFTKRDAEAEQRMAELRIRTLEEMLEQQGSRILLMQTQLDEAKKQVQDIAVRAIEGASGAKALSHINQIAMEQAKGRPNQP